MKRDLKINYGVLDDIIDELQTYENALESMEESLEGVAAIVKTNEGLSIDAWNHDLSSSKEEIKRYQEQVRDLLSLFENYVTDTTSYISPLARGNMMRVSRNNIWANLQQMEIGVTGQVANALMASYEQPGSFLFGVFEDPSDAEKDASEHNKKQLGYIKESIQSTQSVLEGKMEDLKGLYNQKVKPFENTDDAYNDLASDIKGKYTSFFERIGEEFVAPFKDLYDIGRGFFVELANIGLGLLVITKDVGIVLVSHQIPDPIEPAFLKNKSDAIVEDYTNAALQLKEDPMLAVELMAQSMSDTMEEEGVMYVSGGALTYLIPSSLFVKFIKEGSTVKGVGKGRVKEGSAGTGAKSTDNLNDPYVGVKQASDYLKSQGVPRQFRKTTLESFEVGTIKLDVAGPNTYGLRFYDDINANAKGRYLFETFSPQVNRANLALPPDWNRMTGIQQWQVKQDTIIIKGKAAPQYQIGDQYIGGIEQWYITNLDDLTKP